MVHIKKISFLFLLIFMSCDVQINKNFDIADNSEIKKDLVTINGNIDIGNDCKVFGNLSTVNGSITIGKLTQINSSIQTVNGSVSLAKKCEIVGNINVLTGAIEVDDSTVMRGNISNISGDINLSNTNLSGDISTSYGNITLSMGTIINGSIIIDDDDEIPEKMRKVDIVLSENSHINGDLINNNREVTVSVYLEPGSSISGEIIDADITNSINF